jgi:hypothetical protein
LPERFLGAALDLEAAFLAGAFAFAALLFAAAVLSYQHLPVRRAQEYHQFPGRKESRSKGIHGIRAYWHHLKQKFFLSKNGWRVLTFTPDHFLYIS